MQIELVQQPFKCQSSTFSRMNPLTFMSSVHLAHTMKMSATGELVILERNRERRERRERREKREKRGERERGERREKREERGREERGRTKQIYCKIRLRMRRGMERDFVNIEEREKMRQGKSEEGRRGEGVRVRVRE